MGVIQEPTAHSMAAVSMMQSLMLELAARSILKRNVLIDILEDAARSHEQFAIEDGDRAALHRETAKLIREIGKQISLLPS
jgi:hypothetical protein